MTKLKSIYLIGSLRNPAVPKLANELERLTGIEIFDSWFAPGKDTDDYWRRYEKFRGRTYQQALAGHAAQHVFEFDKHHLDRCDAAILLMPAGKSGHLELGYTIGRGKPGYVLFDKEPNRWDVMVRFATATFFNKKELIQFLCK